MFLSNIFFAASLALSYFPIVSNLVDIISLIRCVTEVCSIKV